MKQVLIGLNVLLAVAVIYLFVKVNGMGENGKEKETTLPKVSESKGDGGDKPGVTGKIAFINIDSLNEKSMYIKDLMKELNGRKAVLEGSFQSLQTTYQTKMQELQESYKAGIASEAQLKAEAQKIRQMENDMANKQVQMDNLVNEISEKNAKFQDDVRAFLKEYTKDKYDYVLSYSTAIPSLLVGNEQFDLTTDVIKQLNERYEETKASKPSKK